MLLLLLLVLSYFINSGNIFVDCEFSVFRIFWAFDDRYADTLLIFFFFLSFCVSFRCMKCLFGYMVLSSASLLGLLGSVIVSVAIQKYEITIDIITFYFLLFNFAIVGTISIFFARGIPTFVTQGYLVMTSVILAWQLSQFNDWTAWCLLVALALYDLCAVVRLELGLVLLFLSILIDALI